MNASVDRMEAEITVPLDPSNRSHRDRDRDRAQFRNMPSMNDIVDALALVNFAIARVVIRATAIRSFLPNNSGGSNV